MCPWVPPKALTGFDCRVTAELRSRVSCLRRSAHTTKKIGLAFKESNLVLLISVKRSTINTTATRHTHSVARHPVRPQVLTATPMWKKTHAADRPSSGSPSRNGGTRTRETSRSQSERSTT